MVVRVVAEEPRRSDQAPVNRRKWSVDEPLVYDLAKRILSPNDRGGEHRARVRASELRRLVGVTQRRNSRDEPPLDADLRE